MVCLSRVLLLGAAVTFAVACAAESSLPEEAAAQQPACQQSGCHAQYSSQSACQCNSKCAAYGNCCSDYQSFCVSAPATPSASPAPAPPIPSSHGSASSSGVLGHPTPGKSYPEHAGFTLKFVEEFDAPLDLDTDPIWTWSDGGLPEGQVRFAKEQIRFENGNMKIVAEPISSSIHTQSCSHAEVGWVPPKKLVSGEMRARYNQFRYGRYEARMKAPEVQPSNPNIDGNFVATMFVYKDAKFNHWREIDFEATGDSAHSVTTNVLSADHTSGWQPGIQHSEQISTPGNVRKDFHVYAFEWLPDKITWYIDGQKVREQHPGGIPIPDMACKIMMNLWIFADGAYFGGKQIHNNQYPLTSEYDWFRFYKWDGDTSYPCPGLTNSCLTADDRFMASNNPCDGISQEGGSVNGQTPCVATCQR